METLQLPGARSFEGNNEENWRCWYKKIEIYLIAHTALVSVLSKFSTILTCKRKR